MKLTPHQKIKQLLVFMVTGEKYDSPEDINNQLENCDTDTLSDTENWLRRGTEDTLIPCDSSRHYSSKSVAEKMLDDTWVGWTYWFGGGKYSESQSVPWMEDAYDVTFTEETKVVKKFSR